MNSKHSWNWLVPRFINRRSSASLRGRTATGRPCLALERLEDRNLLSASPHGTTTPAASETPSRDTQVLIGLLQGGLSVTADEINLLKACATGKHIDKLVIESRRLDGELVKIGQEVAKGELTAQQVTADTAKIEFLEVKLNDAVISSVDAPTQKTVQPILVQLSADATSLFLKLDGIKGESTDSKHKGEIDVESLSNDFVKIEGLALKAELITVRKAGKGQQEFLKIEAKIEDVFQKATDAIQKLDDPAAAMLLKTELATFEKGINGLLGIMGDGGNSGVGIVAPPTDDIIT
jgi:type VI protein secretion system component Hcp